MVHYIHFSRFYLAGLTCLILLASRDVPTAVADAASRPPNIVLAFADDLGRYASIYADADRPSPSDVLQTPYFDRVAREGTLFDNAFVSVPSCTPSRAALVSSRHFFRNGSHSQLHHPWMEGYPDPWDEVRGFPLMLRDHGYHIGWSYKMHISEDRMGGRKRNYRQAGSRFNSFSQQVSKADEDAIEDAKAALLEEVRKNFQAFLADREDGQPFFYWFNPTNTHRSWVQGSGKRLWGIDPDDLRGRMPGFLPDQPVIREDFADYLGEAMAFDASVGVLLEHLESIGELDNTFFVVSGDHGAPGFPRGKCNLYDFGSRVPLAMRWPGRVASPRRIRTPVSLLDLGPTFLAAAGLSASDDMDGQDLLPVIGADVDGDEQRLRGYAVIGRENHVDEARPGGLPYPMRAIRTRSFLYIRNFAPDRWPVAQPPLSAPLTTAKKANAGRRMDIDFGPTRSFFVEFEGSQSIADAWELGFAKRPAEELYNVAADPAQTTNLIEDPSFADVAERLRGQLMRILIEGKDPRVVGSGDAFDRPPYAPVRPQRGTVDLERAAKSRRR